MPFNLKGDVFGGTFNNVSGNVNQVTGDMTQVFNSQASGSSARIDNTVRGNMTQVHVTHGEPGLDILYRCMAMGAVHNSREQFKEPACHPGTRTAILEYLMSWATDVRPESTLLWLYGSAGAGKSAIAQTFAGYCSDQGRLGAAFFFKRGHPERGTSTRLFTTIAYQLAVAVPEFRLPIQNVVEEDKVIVARAMDIQFSRLLVEPMSQAPVREIIPVLILEGLEECEDKKSHQEILHLFIDAIRARKLPVRVLITSRSEDHIRRILKTDDTLEICRHIELSADASAYEDIGAYLRDGFSGIRSEYSDTGIDFGNEWPPPDALDHLVTKSSGIFLYATTVIRFVGDEYANPPDPRDRLNLVLSRDPQSTTTLDALYTQILSVIQQQLQPQQLCILHCIWQATLGGASLQLDPEEMDLLLGLGRGISRMVLRPLHSLLYVPPIATRFGYRDGAGYSGSQGGRKGRERQSNGCGGIYGQS
ncbi:hypothetical protein B0H11DRAFT_919998 [Mycena galericulata]|nr:hypothetical protein B0H11DRAFT_919998 [Mycena galericulata]